jgi:hypothetical protein
MINKDYAEYHKKSGQENDNKCWKLCFKKPFSDLKLALHFYHEVLPDSEDKKWATYLIGNVDTGKGVSFGYFKGCFCRII